VYEFAAQSPFTQSRCHKDYTWELQSDIRPGLYEIPNAFIGPDSRAKASFLRYEIKVSYDDTQRVLHHMCGLTVVPGTIVGFDNKAFAKQKCCTHLLRDIRELFEKGVPENSNLSACDAQAGKEAETIRKRLVSHKNELFTFLKYPGLVEPTNNRAEQGLRNSVIFRRLTFGTRTEQGKKNVSLIITVIRTAKLKHLNPIKILKSIVTKDDPGTPGTV
jgi:hypothetical protein